MKSLNDLSDGVMPSQQQENAVPKTREAETVEVTFKIKTDKTNAKVKKSAKLYAGLMAVDLGAEVVRQPSVERVGK